MILAEVSMASRLSSGDSFGRVNIETGQWLGYPTPLTDPWLISSVELFLYKTSGETHDITCVVSTTDDDLAILSELGSKTLPASAVPNGSSLSVDGDWVVFTFDTPILFDTAGYLLVYAQSTASSDNYKLPLVSDNAPGIYVDTANGWATSFGSDNYDIGYRINGEVVAAGVQVVGAASMTGVASIMM